MLIWQKVNDWKFWALANHREDFYQLLLNSNIHSAQGLLYVGSEPLLSLEVGDHLQLLQEAKRLLDPILFEQFFSELFRSERT